MENGSCKRFILSGLVSVILVALAFTSGANTLGMILVGVAIISFGLGAGTVMNSPEPTHKD